MIVLGLNAYHGDAAACLLRDGRFIAAAEEERFRRIKHFAGFPVLAIRYCLQEAGLALKDVDHLAINSDPQANIWRRVSYALLRRPNPRLVFERLRNQKKRISIADEVARAFPNERFRGQVHRVEHHLAHLASSYLASGFEQAACVSVDGFGDFSSAAWGVGDEGAVCVAGRIAFPHSLGVFYQAITQYLGFPRYGDEYKVMGLAPYGAAKFRKEMQQVLCLNTDGGFGLNLQFFRHHKERIVNEWADGAPHVGPLYSQALVDLLGPPGVERDTPDQRLCDIARSAQEAYEDALFHLLGHLSRAYQTDRLALAGGCAMNSVANGRIAARTPFRRIYVPPAAGDAGGAIGAALLVSHRANAEVRLDAGTYAYLGPGVDQRAVEDALVARATEISTAGCLLAKAADDAELVRRVARCIADGKVVGWFQGRMEWGPRALGNRSILADPRRPDMKQILNTKIKRRESFRPFAPSILAECVADWFEGEADVPFMSQVLPIREDRRERIPAVTHVDGSGRLQTVTQDMNPRFHQLIKAFYEVSGVPMVLNTSFNENEPIVCLPSEALDCFLRTEMDVLVLDTFILSRRDPLVAGDEALP